MKLGVVEVQGRKLLAEIDGDTAYGLAWPDSNMIGLIRRGITPTRTYERFPIANAAFRAPLHPGKIIAVGRNYAEHAKETGSVPPERPLLFAKLSSAVIGSGEAITWRTSNTTEVDWECELAVVIGRTAKDVPEDMALDYVFGYTVANDVSARDIQNRIDSQWTRGKGLDTFCPLGPYIVTRDEIADPQNLSLKTTVNGEVMQDGNTRDMIFGVSTLIAYTTRSITLEPGDVIITGTPAGVGMGMKPPRFLKHGDVVTVSVEGIGEIANPCEVNDDLAGGGGL
ncbi:MAG: fumarylacetoacetate hydrolase family protein [Anaerolineae bacterium]|nr:fumarylacetoacetate hydrolase family protein [Anaerolineae bacterium]NUQ05336.1 fumarylacetoacetate hydrolase family protein [Anaerolineae bacterium]